MQSFPYIAFLRGINVGGKQKMPMAVLREVLEQAGFENVATYIQSGNIVFTSSKLDTRELETQIAKCIADAFGCNIPVIVKTPEDVQDSITACPFEKAIQEQSYYTLLFDVPNVNLKAALQAKTYPDEVFLITDSCVYVHCAKGYGKAKCNTNFFEKHLEVLATTRNHRTMLKVLELAFKHVKDH